MTRRCSTRCEDEIIAAAQDQIRRSEDSAYGTSFPEETKRSRSAGWYFSGDAAFDLAVACQLDYPILNDPRPKFLEAMLGNLNYEAGCNPVNVSYLTGLGWKRPREIVDQYAQNQPARAAAERHPDRQYSRAALVGWINTGRSLVN